MLLPAASRGSTLACTTNALHAGILVTVASTGQENETELVHCAHLRAPGDTLLLCGLAVTSDGQGGAGSDVGALASSLGLTVPYYRP